MSSSIDKGGPVGKRRRGRVIALGVASLLLCMAAVGYEIESTRVAAERAEPIPAGELVQVGDSSWRLTCAGGSSKRPPVLLEAGLGDSAATWADLMTRLAGDRRVCAYDRLGYGWSSAARGERAPQTMADEVVEVLAAAGERGPFVVVAHSLGGLIAREFAHRHPDATAGLVLIDPTNEKSMADARPVAVAVGSVQAAASAVGVTRPFLVEQLTDDTSGVLPDAVREQVGFLYRAEALRTSVAELLAADERVPPIDVPTVIIWPHGAPQTDRDHYRAVARDVEVVSAATSSHYVHYTEPAVVVEAIRELDADLTPPG